MNGEGTVSAVATIRCWRRSEKERGPVEQKLQERPGRGEEGRLKPGLAVWAAFQFLQEQEQMEEQEQRQQRWECSGCSWGSGQSGWDRGGFLGEQ